MPVDTSIAQGVTILNNTIEPGLANATPEGVFGYEDSADISSHEMTQLVQEGLGDAPARFVLIGDPMSPNGGFDARFGVSDVPGLLRPELTFPSVGATFNGVTPADDFPTTIYSLEYDADADLPQYPINFLSDLNAFLGLELKLSATCGIFISVVAQHVSSWAALYPA